METLILSCPDAASVAPRTPLSLQRGRRDAVLLQTAFLVDTADLCRRWRLSRAVGDANRRVVFDVCDDAVDPVIVDVAWRAGAHVVCGSGQTPAERLRSVVDAEFARGARAVVVIGPRTPTLPAHLVDHAFRALAWERVVLGPSFDGGLWLVGQQRGRVVVVPDGPWSTPQTMALLSTRLPEPPHLLPFWYDIARADDVERLVWHLRIQRAANTDAAPATWRALQRCGLVGGDAHP